MSPSWQPRAESQGRADATLGERSVWIHTDLTGTGGVKRLTTQGNSWNDLHHRGRYRDSFIYLLKLNMHVLVWENEASNCRDFSLGNRHNTLNLSETC